MTNEEEAEISEKLNSIINNVYNSKITMDNIINNIKSQLASKEKNDEAELRLKKNLFDAMINKYQNVIKRFQEEENKIKKIKETKLIRGAEIALGLELVEQEKKEVIENPQIIKQIYSNKLQKKATNKFINALKDLEERHHDIKNLEKSILQLHKMIMELNVLVQYQREMIDNIVTNISQAKDAVLKGEDKLNKAKKDMEKDCIII